jgi:hypothetical protein
MILEVNANPDMCPTACFAKTLEAAGIDRQRLMTDIVRQAAARGSTAMKSSLRRPCVGGKTI